MTHDYLLDQLALALASLVHETDGVCADTDTMQAARIALRLYDMRRVPQERYGRMGAMDGAA